MVAMAALKEGKHVQSFPEFGPERMGAPVRAYTRISDEPIQIHCGIYTPDAVVILDPTLVDIVPVTEGLKEGGVIIVNTKKSPDELKREKGWEKFRVFTVPATEIAAAVFKTAIPPTNTAMIGALLKAMEVVKLDHVLEVVQEWAKERFPGRPEIAENNIRVIKEAYEKAREA